MLLNIKLQVLQWDSYFDEEDMLPEEVCFEIDYSDKNIKFKNGKKMVDPNLICESCSYEAREEYDADIVVIGKIEILNRDDVEIDPDPDQ